ncbi:hypothetical protein ACQR1Q_30000, partial [Bradyrhizobium oligotrophicum]
MRGQLASARAVPNFAVHASRMAPITSRPLVRGSGCFIVGVPNGSAITPCAADSNAEASRGARPADGSQAVDGAVTITPAQLGYLLEGIDWRH